MFSKGPARKQVTIKCCLLQTFLYDRYFQGFGSNATIKLSSSLIPRNQISLLQFSWWARKQKALSSCESKAFAQPLCTSARTTRSKWITQSQHAFSTASPPEPCSQHPPTFIQEHRKWQGFLQWFSKTKPPQEEMQGSFCHLIQCKAQGNPGNDCFLKTCQLHDRVSWAGQPAAILPDWE